MYECIGGKGLSRTNVERCPWRRWWWCFGQVKRLPQAATAEKLVYEISSSNELRAWWRDMVETRNLAETSIDLQTVLSWTKDSSENGIQLKTAHIWKTRSAENSVHLKIESIWKERVVVDSNVPHANSKTCNQHQHGNESQGRNSPAEAQENTKSLRKKMIRSL